MPVMSEEEEDDDRRSDDDDVDELTEDNASLVSPWLPSMNLVEMGLLNLTADCHLKIRFCSYAFYCLFRKSAL